MRMVARLEEVGKGKRQEDGMQMKPNIILLSPYWAPFVAGVALGLTLLLTFYLTGHGLGASGAYTAATAALVEAANGGLA